MTAAIVYGGVLFTIVATYFIGRALDKDQSTAHATWKTGCIGLKTVIQSVVLGCIGGPIVYLFKGGKEELWFCVVAMMAAPFLVDLLRPTVTVHSESQLTEKSVRTLNVAHVVAIVICVLFLGLFALVSFVS